MWITITNMIKTYPQAVYKHVYNFYTINVRLLNKNITKGPRNVDKSTCLYIDLYTFYCTYIAIFLCILHNMMWVPLYIDKTLRMTTICSVKLSTNR